MISAASFRIEQTRLVANTRVVLAAVALAATYLDPSQPSKSPFVAYLILIIYFSHALALALVRGRDSRPRKRVDFVEHVVDVLTFSSFIYMTEGLTSPFFPVFTYSLLVAHLRWRWRGTLITACVVIALLLAMLLKIEADDVGYVLVRCAYLAVLAVLIAWIGGRQETFLDKLARVAAWPTTSTSAQSPLGLLLDYAGRVMGAPCALLVWRGEDDIVLNVARWQNSKLDFLQTCFDAARPIVAAPIATRATLSIERQGQRSVLVSERDSVRRWEGAPLDADFARDYAPGSVLILPVREEGELKHLILSGKSDFTSDDLLLADVVASYVSSHLTELSLLERLRETAVIDERIRLARDLHDGVLQNLTATRLHLQRSQRLLATESPQAAERLGEVQQVIERDQRSLREFINELKPAAGNSPTPLLSLAEDLEHLARVLMERWDVRITWTIRPGDLSLAPEAAYQLRRILEEATANAKKHGKCRSIDLMIIAGERGINVVITNDGSGLPTPERSPRNLHERIASLGGTLEVRSDTGKTVLDIMLPLTRFMCEHAG
jgi:signal transduction histidine kinase